MKNTIIDFIRVPVDENGAILYDIISVRDIFEEYIAKTGHEAFILPADITIWEDLDIQSLKLVQNYLDGIIKKKEQEEKNV